MNTLKNNSTQQVPVLQALAEVSSAAIAGATLGTFVDMLLQDEERVGTNIGATLGLTLGVLGQLSKF